VAWRVATVCVLDVLSVGNETTPVVCLADCKEERAAEAVEPWCSIVLRHTVERALDK
jgi:hypothetical protein